MPLKSVTRFLTLASLFLIPLFPLIVANTFFFPFITGKAFYFRTLVEIAFASWVVLAFLDAKYRPRLNGLTVGVTIFALVTLVADLVGVNPLRSLWSNFERMEGWITVVHLWMFFMVASSVFGPSANGGDGRKMWYRWINTSLAVAFIVGCYGFGQLFGWFVIHQGATRVDASLGNAAYMAVYMLLSAGFAAYLFFEARKAVAASSTRLQWLYGILVVMFSFLLYETATRGTILGLVGGIMLALLVYAIFAGKKQDANFGSNSNNNPNAIGSPTISRSRWIAGGIVGLFIIGIVAFIGLRHQPFIANNPVLGRLASISFSSTESVSRLYIWQEALVGFKQRPVLGWGQENFNYVFNANYNPKMWSQEQWFDRAHSVYIDWAINSGVVGLVAYLALYVLFLLAVWKSTLSIAEKSALTGLLAGYAVHNLFVFDNLASYVLFFAMLAFVTSLPKKTTSLPTIVGGNKEVGVEVIEYVVAPIAIIALIFGVYWFTWRPIQENTGLIAALQSCGSNSQGSVPDPALFQNTLSVGSYVGLQETREQLFSCAGQVISAQQIPSPTKQAFFTLATQEIQAQIAATPKDARAYVLSGSFLDQIGAFSQAEPLLINAHLLSPAKQTIDFELGNDYINEGKLSQAVDIFKQAYYSATDDTDAQTGYATALVIDGQDIQAHAIFGADQSLFDTDGMAQAYSVAKEYPKAIAIYEQLIGTSTDNVSLQLKLAQTQYGAGMKSVAVSTLQLIEKNHPEYKTQLDAAIQQAEAGK